MVTNLPPIAYKFRELLLIPNIIDPDDRRRRQVLNILLIFCIAVSFMGTILALTVMSVTETSPILPFLILGFFGSLWFINRSSRLPSWVSGVIFIMVSIIYFAQADNPSELYNGRSTVMWAIPIMVSALIFPPGYSFLVALTICGLMVFFTPPDPHYPGYSINFYSMLALLTISFIMWLGMRIANRAVREARKHAENASRNAANLQAVLNSIAEGVLVLDLDGQILSANPALLKMIPEEQLAKLISKPMDKNIRLNRRFLSITKSPVPEVGSVAVFHDETRRIETERAKDALLATASHELRTPLTAVMNYLEMMQVFIRMGRINTPDFDDYMNRAIENMHRLHGLVNNILDQAQIQAGALELKEKFFNLPELLEKNHQLLQVLIEQKKLAYSLSIAPDVPKELKGDPDRLHQVLVNLVGNAIKFTREGGINVKVFLLNKDNLAIEVADTGPGIPDERLPDIFEAFRRGSDYVQREQQGAGLGLSITREIVTRMGGEISVASTLGVGSTFTVSIPIHP
jgi:signal transduction histidine kinase